MRSHIIRKPAFGFSFCPLLLILMLNMEQDEGAGIVRGASLTAGMCWPDGQTRSSDLSAPLILARLLTPAGFGIVAMATLVVNLANVILDMGVKNVALIQGSIRSGRFLIKKMRLNGLLKNDLMARP